MADQRVRLDGLLPGAGEVAVTGVSLDSRRVRPGDLYAALPGQYAHGAQFAAQAAARGAVAILTDPQGREMLGDHLPVIVVRDPRAALAEIAAAVYGHPARAMRMFGITGTNGKTSTMFLLEAALTVLGQRVGTLGTIGFRVAGAPLEHGRSTVTTPEAPDLHQLLADMRDSAVTSVAMEVSSHALTLHRVAGITFDVAAFTNLGRDHLDFHHSVENYFEAKTRLFLNGRARTCVVNIDGEWGLRLAGLIAEQGIPLLTTSSSGQADFTLVDHRSDAEQRSLVRVATPIGELRFTVGLAGVFNVHNAITAAAMAHAAGLDVARAVTGFERAAVPGRMQRVRLGPGAPRVIVDFAHTPQAVTAALSELPPPRIAVLGAGGDRDPGKREPMGAAAAANAELVVVTDDNPRSEVPEAIRARVLAGAQDAGAAEAVDGGDRRAAIALALRRATPATWVAVLGKGHESGQDIAGVIREFDDVSVVEQEWHRLSTEGETGA